VEHRKKKSTDTAVHLLFVGNVIPRKGLDVLVRALDSLQRSDWLLTVVGDTQADGQYFEELRRLVQANGLDNRVSFEGRISEEQLHATYANCQVLVVPSRYEGFGIVYLEAMAYGTPVIASTAGAAREFITDGEEGFLVTPDDVDELARRLQIVIENPALRHQMGQQARHTWEAHPTWMETGQTVETFLETLIHSEPNISPPIRE
jgi:glycosyltransferase involved in cell wall biosynthesis